MRQPSTIAVAQSHSRRRLPAAAVLPVCALLGLLARPAGAGEETSGLFVQFTATRAQEEVPASLATKQMCPDRPGTHTFAPDLRIEDRNQVSITNTFVNFEFTMTLTRRGAQETLEKAARFRVTRNGTRPIAGGAARINFFLQPGDCVDLLFAPKTDIMLLNGEVLTASLFLTREPAGGPAPPPPPPGPGPLATCTINFDGGCPNAGAQCGASFSGGNGCISIGVGSCYSSGAFSYEVGAGQTLTIDLEGDLEALDVFFAANGTGSGTMRFLDANGAQVGSPLTTNGNCTSSMPDSQRLGFATPVRSIEVTSEGSASFLDTFVVNPR